MDQRPDKPVQYEVFLSDFRKIPCFANSVMWAFGGGIIAGILSYLKFRNHKTSSSFAVFGFVVTAAVRWPICRSQFSNRLELEKEFRRVMSNSNADAVKQQPQQSPAPQQQQKPHTWTTCVLFIKYTWSQLYAAARSHSSLRRYWNAAVSGEANIAAIILSTVSLSSFSFPTTKNPAQGGAWWTLTYSS